ncbi:MAG: glycosyltransferase family 2 protein [Planctomycetota bacterium]
MTAARQPDAPAPRDAPALRLTHAEVRRVSLVVPTYREADALPHLLDRLQALRHQTGYDLQVLIMDDATGDGSEAIIARADLPWVDYIARTGPRGLSAAVVEGFTLARHPFVVVMDADLSHPPEAIPDLLDALDQGHDFVVGSRYAPGGSTDADWGLGRWLNSRIATLLARPLTHLSDPMAGFFAFRRSLLQQAEPLSPVGYKIGLEVLVKARCTRAGEVPIHFTDRVHGESKLSLTEQLKYLQHLRRLYLFKLGNRTSYARFFAVGALGLSVNLAALTALLALGVAAVPALAGGIAVSLISGFFLHQQPTPGSRPEGSWLRRVRSFGAACAIGAAVQLAVAVSVLHLSPGTLPQLAACLGVLAGAPFSFIGSRYLVFKRNHIRPKTTP